MTKRKTFLRISTLVLLIFVFVGLAFSSTEAADELSCGETNANLLDQDNFNPENDSTMTCLGEHFFDNCSEASAIINGGNLQIKGGTMDDCRVGNSEIESSINLNNLIQEMESDSEYTPPESHPGALATVAVVMVGFENIPKNGGGDNLKPIVIENKELGNRLKGKIILRVEQNGEAYYINPKDQSMHFLGRPAEAFNIMRDQGIGITNSDLNKIPVGLSSLSGQDSDNDGLSDMFEDAIGTDKNNSDTDGDGYSDKEELEDNYNPKGQGKLNIDNSFAEKQKGKILLQVENNGEAWYINPEDDKRYFLGRPVDAFSVMRNLGLGISEGDFGKISNNEVVVTSNEQIKNDKYERIITEYINDYEIVEGYNGYTEYDFIKIKSYEANSPEKVVLPTKRMEISLPSDVEVQSVEIERKTPIVINNVNIPVENPCSETDMLENNCLLYTEADEVGEKFEKTHFYFVAKHSQYKQLMINFTPVSYNASKNEAILYRDVKIKYSYKTNKDAILLNSLPDKRYYVLGEKINNQMNVKNVSDKKIELDLVCELKDRMQKTIYSEVISINSDSDENTSVGCSIDVPFAGGSYWVVTSLKQGDKELGKSSEHINITAGDEPIITLYDYKVGEDGIFELSYSNPTDEQLDVAFGFTLFDGSTPIIEYMPIVYYVDGKKSQTHTFNWEIPQDFKCQNYLAVGTVKINNHIMTVSKNISVECN